MVLLEAFDSGAAIVTSLGTVSGYLAAVIPVGLGLWAVLFGVGYAKKGARKSAS